MSRRPPLKKDSLDVSKHRLHAERLRVTDPRSSRLFSRRAIFHTKRLRHTGGVGGISLVEMHELTLHDFFRHTGHRSGDVAE